MKNKGLLLGAAILGVSFIAASGFLISKTGKSFIKDARQTAMLYTPGEMVKMFPPDYTAENKERENIFGAQKYIAKLLASDPNNLQLDQKYVRQAINQIQAKRSKRSSTSLLHWEELGPDNVGGRTRAIWIDPTNTNHLLAGGVTGGIFTSSNGGLSWSPLASNGVYGNHNISSIVQDGDGNIYYGTGESFVITQQNGFSGLTGHIGGGVYKSTDGGQTFSVLDSTLPNPNFTNQAWSYVNALAVSPTTNYLYAATETGLFYSKDEGATWTHVVGGDLVTSDIGKPCKDVKVSANGVVYASINRKFFRSDDGENFSQYLVTGFPTTGVSLIVFALSPQDPNYVYVSIANNAGGLRGVFRSKDAGYTWESYSPENSSLLNPLGNQGDYDNVIAVDPQNKNRVFVGGQLSLIAGGNDVGWTTIAYWIPSGATNPYYVHADMHAIVFDPTNPNVMYVGSDGGINKTLNAADPQPLFTTRNKGYNVTQFYDMDASVSGELLAGAQDNGTNYIDFNGNTHQTGTEVNGGDGGAVAISRYNSSAFFAETPNGGLVRSSDMGNNFGDFFDVFASNNATADFIAPMHLWEGNDTTSFFLYGVLNKVLLTKQATDFSVLPTWYAINTNSFVSAIASTKNGTFFVGTETGYIYRISGLLGATYEPSNNRIVPNTFVSKNIKTFAGRYITSIAVDPEDSAHIVVTMAQYGKTDYVYESVNALDNNSVTFTSIQGDLPAMPVYGAVIDAYNRNNIILGTDFGIWATTNGNGSGSATSWNEEDEGLSSIPIYGLRQRYLYDEGCQVVYAASYGRGMFRTTSLTSANAPSCNLVSGLSNPTAPLTVSELNLYPNPAVDKALLDITLEKTANVDVRIIDMMGRVYQNKNYGQLSGKQQLQLDVSQLPAGSYIVSVQTGDKNTSRAIVVMK